MLPKIKNVFICIGNMLKFCCHPYTTTVACFGCLEQILSLFITCQSSMCSLIIFGPSFSECSHEVVTPNDHILQCHETLCDARWHQLHWGSGCNDVIRYTYNVACLQTLIPCWWGRLFLFFGGGKLALLAIVFRL